MKAITLRNIPPELAQVLEEHSKTYRMSLNKTVIRLLEKAIGLRESPPSARRHHELDDLAGSWSEQQAREFDQALAEQRQIEPELWD